MNIRETSAYSVKLVTQKKLNAISAMLGSSKSETVELITDYWLSNQNQETQNLVNILMKTQERSEE